METRDFMNSSSAMDELFRFLLDNTSDGLYCVDRDRVIRFWNQGAEGITGYRSDEVLGRSCRDQILVHTDWTGACLCDSACPLAQAIEDGQQREEKVFLKHKEGHRIPVRIRVAAMGDESGERGGIQVFCRADAGVNGAEEAAVTDPVTGLANRTYVESIVAEKRETLNRGGRPYAVLFVRLNGLRGTEGMLAPEAAVALCRAVGATLKTCVRPDDLVGYWGNGEFVIVLTGAGEEQGRMVATRCRGLLRSCAVEWQGTTLIPEASIRIAVAEAGNSGVPVFRSVEGA